MKDALTRMEDIEAKFRVKASELGLDLDKLYERQYMVNPLPILMIEREEPTEENMYHAAEYLKFLTLVSSDVFMMTAMMLSVWKLGGNPKGLLMAGEAALKAELLENLAEWVEHFRHRQHPATLSVMRAKKTLGDQADRIEWLERQLEETKELLHAVGAGRADSRLRRNVEEALLHLETNYDIDGASMADSDAARTLRAAIDFPTAGGQADTELEDNLGREAET